METPNAASLGVVSNTGIDLPHRFFESRNDVRSDGHGTQRTGCSKGRSALRRAARRGGSGVRSTRWGVQKPCLQVFAGLSLNGFTTRHGLWYRASQSDSDAFAP